MILDAGLILDAYAGPGGWSEGLRFIGLTDIGIELDATACDTRSAAGHATVCADVTSFPLHLAGRVEGLIMSPPCQAFSAAGKGAGRDVLPELVSAIRAGDWTGPAHDDDRIRHVLEVGRWAETLYPTWIACEQVPPVLPLWQAYADRWRHLYGWSAWAVVLNTANYGIPQIRRRAFLIARTDGRGAVAPTATHCEGGALTLDGELLPWVTMADALGWGYDHRGSPTVTGGGGKTGGPEPFGHAARTALRSWTHERPATAVCGDPRLSPPGYRGRPDDYDADGTYTGARSMDDAIKLTIRDALILQGFPPDYPVQGTKTKQFEQIGNAVPPPLAAAVVAAVAGVPVREAAA